MKGKKFTFYNDDSGIQDTGSHPNKHEPKKHWCGRTSRAMSIKRCLDAEQQNNEEWSCGNVQKTCKDAGWTKEGQAQKVKDDLTSQLETTGLQTALAPDTSPPLSALGASMPSASGSNMMLYVGVGVGVLALGMIIVFVLKKPAGSAGAAASPSPRS